MQKANELSDFHALSLRQWIRWQLLDLKQAKMSLKSANCPLKKPWSHVKHSWTFWNCMEIWIVIRGYKLGDIVYTRPSRDWEDSMQDWQSCFFLLWRRNNFCCRSSPSSFVLHAVHPFSFSFKTVKPLCPFFRVDTVYRITEYVMCICICFWASKWFMFTSTTFCMEIIQIFKNLPTSSDTRG